MSPAAAPAEEFSLDEFTKEFGISTATAAKVSTGSGNTKDPVKTFKDELSKQIELVKEVKTKHPSFIEAGDLKNVGRGKPKNWFSVKNGNLIVSTYFGNSKFIKPVPVTSWDDAEKFYSGILAWLDQGKFDAKIQGILSSRGNRKARLDISYSEKTALIAEVGNDAFKKMSRKKREEWLNRRKAIAAGADPDTGEV